MTYHPLVVALVTALEQHAQDGHDPAEIRNASVSTGVGSSRVLIHSSEPPPVGAPFEECLGVYETRTAAGAHEATTLWWGIPI